MPNIGEAGSAESQSPQTVGFDPLHGFSWRDLDSLGQFIINDALLNAPDGSLVTPEMVIDGEAMTADSRPDIRMNAWNEQDFIF